MDIFILITLLVIAAETTYLVVKNDKKTKYSKNQQTPIFVDTSVLIDGRIIAIAQSGFITSTLYIPRSVIGELQFLADNGDTEKRTRARHGLDVVSELQALKTVKTEIFSDSTTAEEGVDNRLLSLAKKYKGAICTIDFNLNKVAQVEGLAVLNVNDLAKTLRMAYLPGEKLLLELTQKGHDSHQAIGHLADGTMVVVEHASSSIGKSVEVEFIRSLQTAAGKMMFARLVGGPQPKKEQSKLQPKGRQQVVAKAVDQAEQPKRQVQKSQPKQESRSPRQQQRRRPKTNEDRLVELANQ